jgi:hypothetical protein
MILNEDLGCPLKAGFEVITEGTRAVLSGLPGPYPFVAQPHRSIRVGLAFCQLEIALRELAREAGDAVT